MVTTKLKFVNKKIVSGSPTAGGFPGYLRNGITNKTVHMTNDKNMAFFLSSFENGRILRLKA